VRRVSSQASSAILASAAATDTLQQQLLFRSSIAGTTDASVSMVRDVWSTAYATDCPTGPPATKQPTWDRVATASERQAVTSSLSDATDKARLLSVTSPHSSDWLHALPLSGYGLRLDDRAIHIAVGLRLGANICEPHQCPCGASVDADTWSVVQRGQQSLCEASQPERPTQGPTGLYELYLLTVPIEEVAR